MVNRRRVGRKPSVLLCGYYGEHNLGDDALLLVLVSQISTDWDLLITARDQDSVRRLVPNACTVNRRSLSETVRSLDHVDVVVLGGGSLLQDGTSFKSLFYYLILLWSARLKRRPILLWGQGLGPLKRRLSRLLVRYTLSGIKAVSWRDPASMHQAQRWKLNTAMVMGPDPVWCHPAPAWNGGSRLILCLRPTPLLDQQGWSVLLESVDRFSARERLQVIWLAFHAEQDATLLDDLDQQHLIPDRLNARSEQVTAESLAQVQSVFRDASLVIAMRLHALILAATGGCPTTALSYDPKVKAAAELAALPWFDLNEPLNINGLMDQWTHAVHGPCDHQQLERLRLNAGIHREMLIRELNSIV